MAHSDPDHPTRHAVMVCIDGVAKRQGGGAWHNTSEGKKQRMFTVTVTYNDTNTRKLTSRYPFSYLYVHYVYHGCSKSFG